MDAVRISGAEHFHRGNRVDLVRLDLPDHNLRETLSLLGFELGELTREQLAIVLAARALRTVLASLQIDYSSTRAAGGEAASLPPPSTVADRQTDHPAGPPAAAEVNTDTDDDVGPLEGLHQIAQSLPAELACLGLEPLEFMRRLVTGELRGIVRIPAPAPPRPSPRWEPAHRPDQSDVPPVIRPLVAHVLLDVSESMGKRDRRGVVARGAALAFLLMSHEREADLQLTPFASAPGETTSVKGVSGLHAQATRVLTVPNSGSTNIQGTLAKIAAEALPSQRTDLLLITDGLSTLSTNPLGSAHLHTVRIIVSEGEWNDRLQQELEGNMKILRQWSDTLIEMDLKAIMREIRPNLDDVLPFGHQLEGFGARLEEVVCERQFQTLVREVDNLEMLCVDLEATQSLERQPLHARTAYARLKERLADCRALVGVADVYDLIGANVAKLGPETAQRMRVLCELKAPVAEFGVGVRGGKTTELQVTLGRGAGGGVPVVDWLAIWRKLVAWIAARLGVSRNSGPR